MADRDRPLLAVCVPTHHGRAEALSELFERLLPQLPADGMVEVCVSDNASRDATRELIGAHQANNEAVRYSRNESDLGLAGNIFAVVEMARAEYCWLLGSDDAPAPGAVEKLLAALGANAGVSGAHVGFLRRRGHDLDAPGQDWPPDMLPEPGALRVGSADQYFEQLGMLALTLSLNVVHRERWLEVVAAEQRRAERTPIHPHVYVIGRMAQRWPDWLWVEDRITLLREAAFYLAGDEQRAPQTSDLGRELRQMTADISSVWASLHGRRSATHRALMRRFGAWVLHPAAAAWRKLASPGGTREDILYLGFVRHYWRYPEFQRKTLPLLLTPTRRLRVAASGPEPAGDDSGEREDRARARLSTDAASERLIAVAGPLIEGRGAWAEIFVHNECDATLSFTGAHYAALYARWRNLETDEIAATQMFLTPLFPPVRPGGVRRLEQLLAVPEPGRYELIVDLFSRRTKATLTGGKPAMAEVEVVAPGGG